MTEQIPDPLVKRLSELDRSGLELLSARSTDALFKKIVDVACHQVDAAYAFMNVRSDDHNSEEVITFGLPRKDLQKALSGTLSQVLVAELRQSSSPKRKKNPLTKTGSLPGDAFGIRSAIGAPIRQAEKSLGEIVCVNKRNGEQFTVDDEKVMACAGSLCRGGHHQYARVCQAGLTRQGAGAAQRESGAPEPIGCNPGFFHGDK